jgi:predicted transport protein
MALDPAITEQFLKLYVAYKTESSFVDVVPQVARLRLSLNLPFETLHDERKLAWDVTGRGHWGNGNVEVALDEAPDFPYVMGLVRQAYEFQITGD